MFTSAHLPCPAPRIHDPRTEIAAACSCSAISMQWPPGELIILRVSGEVDLSTLPVLEGALADVLRRRPRCLIVDLSKLTFCSVRGLTVLSRAGLAAVGQGVEYAVCEVSRHLNRVWMTMPPGDYLPVRHPTVAIGVITAMVHGDRSAARHAPLEPRERNRSLSRKDSSDGYPTDHQPAA